MSSTKAKGAASEAAEQAAKQEAPKPTAAFDATSGCRFSVKQTNAAATLHQLHQLLDDSFHAVDALLLPQGCRIEIIIEP